MYSKLVDGSASFGGGTYDALRLILGIPVGDGGHEGMKTVGSCIVWNAGGGVGAEHARRPWLMAAPRLRLRGGEGTGMTNDMPSSPSCSPSASLPLPFLDFFTRCGR